ARRRVTAARHDETGASVWQGRSGTSVTPGNRDRLGETCGAGQDEIGSTESRVGEGAQVRFRFRVCDEEAAAFAGGPREILGSAPYLLEGQERHGQCRARAQDLDEIRGSGAVVGIAADGRAVDGDTVHGEETVHHGAAHGRKGRTHEGGAGPRALDERVELDG